jgi:hypothetical protein
VDRSQQTNSTRESLRKIRQETRQTRSLETLRQNFEILQSIRRNSMDDFDLQVMIGDIHQEIVDRARYLRGDTPPPTTTQDDHSVIFHAKPSDRRFLEPVSAPLPVAPADPSVGPLTTNNPPPRALVPQLEPIPTPTRSDAAEIPPEVTRIDPVSWKRTLWLAAFLAAIVLAVIVSLIQFARKANFPEENQTQTEQPAKAATTASAATTPVSVSPTLRLYTDLTAGTATIDNETPRSLVDGELNLDNLPAGQHSMKVTSAGGSASFQFEITGKNAPKVIGSPQATNALLVLVSQQDGHGQLVTTAGPSEILLDGKAAGETSTAGLELVGLGSTDHDLQLVHDRDRQRFVMTYTPAPVLTVYVKSDPNTGILQVVTGQDNVEVYIEDVVFRRRTDHGQVRVSIRAGHYPIRVHKDGFVDPPVQWVDVKKADVAQVRFELAPVNAIATLQIHGAMPGTTAYVDHDFVAAVGADGAAKVSNIKPGDHTIELRHDLAVTKRLQRTFHTGETVTLTGADVTLEKTVADAGKPSSGVVVVPVGSSTSETTTNETQPENTRVQIGGGFIPYGTPKSAGHYSFRTQGHVGGILKKSKLQWYAGFQDRDNYVLFTLDGKHAEVREMRNGKNILWNRVPCNVDSSTWVQVDMAVKPGTVSARVKGSGENWVDIGSVASLGRDFTQDKVGFYIPPNDEVAVANFKFANR